MIAPDDRLQSPPDRPCGSHPYASTLGEDGRPFRNPASSNEQPPLTAASSFFISVGSYEARPSPTDPDNQGVARFDFHNPWSAWLRPGASARWTTSRCGLVCPRSGHGRLIPHLTSRIKSREAKPFTRPASLNPQPSTINYIHMLA
jgi:hypothetical protein